jgi:hypothetical protein
MVDGPHWNDGARRWRRPGPAMPADAGDPNSGMISSVRNSTAMGERSSARAMFCDWNELSTDATKIAAI